jgi:hypothetical protein
MSEIPVSKVKFEMPEEFHTVRWDRERIIALFEKHTLPKLKNEAKNLLEALDAYKKGDYESYTKLRDIISEISKL